MTATPATPTRAAVEATVRPPLTVWLYLGASWLLGWWMTYDGLHQRLWGDYVRMGGQLGPWAGLAEAVGINPQRLGLAFVALGLAFIGASFGIYWRRRWAYSVALVASAVSLLYLGFGTPVALACLILLLLPPSRAHLLGAASP